MSMSNVTKRVKEIHRKIQQIYGSIRIEKATDMVYSESSHRADMSFPRYTG